jgi:hypothetical protein
METTEEVIAFKQRILQEAPASTTRDIIKGREKDKIFYMKEPGNDATISGTGSVIFRKGWGAQPIVSRFGGIISADKKLRELGYRPYNIFAGMEYEQYEQKHKYAKAEKERRETIFVQRVAPAEKQRRSEFPEINQNQIPNISEYGQAVMPQYAPRQPQNRLGYNELLAKMNASTGDMSQIARFYRSQTYTPNEFADFTYKGINKAQAASAFFKGKTVSIPASPKSGMKGKSGGARRWKK